MSNALNESIISLGTDLYAMKLYWVAISALCFYDYFLTLGDEIKYAWKGEKTPVFWLFILNRYLAPIFVFITLVAYFAPAFDLDVCARYGFMETLETALLTTTAEIFLTLRVYALMPMRKHKKIVLYISGMIMAWQWAIAIYAMSQSSQGTDQPALLLSKRAALPPLPPLPDADPFHICIFISTLTVTPWVEAYLCFCLAFDCLVFLAIMAITLRANRSYHFVRTMQVIQRDGIIYFFVLLSSNVTWLALIIHARPGLKFVHNQPAMIISSIMINRITLNLKRSSQRRSESVHVVSWGVRVFETLSTTDSDATLTGSTVRDHLELSSFQKDGKGRAMADKAMV